MAIFESRFLNLCDAELQSEDGDTFQVHRIVLAMKSKYFWSMFCDTGESRRQFTIPGISGKSLRQVLKYIYADNVFFETDKNLDVMLAADYLCLEYLYSTIKRHLMKEMSVTIPNCLPLLNTACRTNSVCIPRKILIFVVRKFEEILLTQKNDLADLSLDVLEKILKSRNLKVRSETTVWLAIVEWTIKDTSSRLQYVPQLLMSLAWKELDENLVKEILQHEIVSENIFMKDLNELKGFTSNVDALLYFLKSHSCYSKQPIHNRRPSRLHLITYYNKESDDDDDDYNSSDENVYRPGTTCNLYITCDENVDLWRKIGEKEDCHFRFSTVVGHNVYLFGRWMCKKFNVITQKWMPMSSFKEDYENIHRDDVSIFEIDGCIYIVGTCSRLNCVTMEMYDTLRDKWSRGASFKGMLNVKAATLNKKIYMVGESQSHEMITGVFDTVTKKWGLLPPPNASRHHFSVLAYREKVYVIGGYVDTDNDDEYPDWKQDVPVMNEVFDPQTNMWGEFPRLPHSYRGSYAFVFNDQITAYEPWSPTDTVFCWDQVKGQWEELVLSSRIDFPLLSFSTIDDDDTIRALMKVNRDPRIHPEKSLFS